MNAIDINPDYKAIYNKVKEQFVQSKYFNYGACDETYYTLKVFETAKKIMRRLHKNVNVSLILVSAILHDVGKSYINLSLVFSNNHKLPNGQNEWDKHNIYGLPIAKKILSGMGHSSEFIIAVSELIEKHELEEKINSSKTLELKVLQDADMIADLGFAGFIRPFSFGAQTGRGVIDSIKFLQQVTQKVDPNLLNLKISRDIALEQLKIQKRLVKSISKDINSELLK